MIRFLSICTNVKVYLYEARIFLLVDNFFILFYPLTINIINFVEKNWIFEILSVLFLRVTLLKVIVQSKFLRNDAGKKTQVPSSPVLRAGPIKLNV